MTAQVADLGIACHSNVIDEAATKTPTLKRIHESSTGIGTSDEGRAEQEVNQEGKIQLIAAYASNNITTDHIQKT
eukprot:Gb_17247 [translate_table: standard]